MCIKCVHVYVHDIMQVYGHVYVHVHDIAHVYTSGISIRNLSPPLIL